MRKILIIFLFGLLFIQPVIANDDEEVSLQNNFISKITDLQQDVWPDIQDIEISKSPLETGITEFSANSFEHRVKLYNELAQTVNNVYNLQIENTNAAACLLKEPLTHKFEKGPLENLHTWGVIQMNMGTTIPQHGDTDTTFKVGLINALIDGQFKGGKEDFRIMFDPTPQHNRSFMSQFIQDLYIETNRIPHHTLMLGNSRPGVGIEGAQSPYTLPLANRSQISRNLANVRKFGVRLKGDYSYLDYDLGGYSSDTYFTEFMPGAEFNGWMNFKPLAKANEKYGKLVTGGGIVTGERNSTDFFTAGAYVGYEYKKLWMRTEYANANGSNGGAGLTKKKQQGWYITLGYHITKKLEAILRYDEFDADKTVKDNNKREYTAGINYYLKGQALKLILNYVYYQDRNKTDSHRIIVGTQIAL